jgi:glycerate dehydrogenase
MSKIVVLDAHPLNPGDLSWEPLHALGACTVHEQTAAEDILDRCAGAEIVLTNKVPLSAATIEHLPHLRYIGVMATGYNIVDTAVAARRDIVVANVPSYGTRSVAQHTIALLLELTNKVGRHATGVRDGDWCRSPAWSYWMEPLLELDDRSMGIVGRGRIGAAVGQAAEAFGLRVSYTSSRDGRDGLVRLLMQSDVISLHCPLTPDTKELINRASIEHCKPTALLLNTARGGLVNEQDLAAALNSSRLAGAALDVLSTEPPSPANPLLRARNCIITPHIGWASSAARARLLDKAVQNVGAFLAGTPANRVN